MSLPWFNGTASLNRFHTLFWCFHCQLGTSKTTHLTNDPFLRKPHMKVKENWKLWITLNMFECGTDTQFSMANFLHNIYFQNIKNTPKFPSLA